MADRKPVDWWGNIRKKFPDKTDDEIRQYFGEVAKRRKIRGTGGFYNNPDLARTAQQKSVESRLKNKEG